MESSCGCGVGGRFCGEGVSSSKVGMACCMKPRVSLWMGVVFCFPAVLVSLICSYIYPLLAQFDNTIKNTLKNACLLSIGNLPYSVVMAALNLAAPALFFFATGFFLKTCIFWLLIGGALVAMLNSYLLRKIFKKYFELD